MALELIQNQAATVEFAPDCRASSAVARLYSPEGSLIETITPTLDSVDTTVTSVGATPDLLTLNSVTGIVVGREYWYTSAAGWSAKVRVASVSGSVVRLETPPADAPAAADTFKGLTFTASISSSSTATRGKHYRLDWQFGTGASMRSDRQIAHIVVSQFRAPATPDDAKRVAYENFANWARSESYGTWLRIAQAATDRVRTLLVAEEDYPHIIGDRDAFAAAGEIAIRLELAKRGRIPAGYEATSYRTEQEQYLRVAVREALAGVTVDRNDDGVAQAAETLSIRSSLIERW